MPNSLVHHALQAGEIQRRSTAGESCTKLGAAVFETRVASGYTREKFIDMLGFDAIPKDDQYVILLALEAYDPEERPQQVVFVDPYVVGDVLNLQLSKVYDFLKALKQKIKYKP